MSPNLAERFLEWVVGYQVDWDASGTWAQLAAALIALEVARRISRGELSAQRQVAADERAEFAAMVQGVCEEAASFIYDTSRLLSDYGSVALIVQDAEDEPTSASLVNALKGLDLNRMPNAKTALGVMELRRLLGWTKANVRSARTQYSALQDLVDASHGAAMDTWRENAQDALNRIRAGLAEAAEADRKLLKGGPRIAWTKRRRR